MICIGKLACSFIATKSTIVFSVYLQSMVPDLFIVVLTWSPIVNKIVYIDDGHKL